MTQQCRFCGSSLTVSFADLGEMPLANAYPRSLEEASQESRYPLHARVCEQCLLVQVEDVVSPEEIFSDYAYFSSYSSSWVERARRFAADCTDRFGLGPESRVVEVASNDGYLLRHFVDAGVPSLGIEPAANVAAEARRQGVDTHVGFFGKDTASAIVAERGSADLLVANNVFAHVPDLHDFTAGLAASLGRTGILSIEVQHLLPLIEQVAFDTIYHEHYSYFSLLTAERVLAAHGLVVVDIEALSTHGGSLRLWARHHGSGSPVAPRVHAMRDREHAAGLGRPESYESFQAKVHQCRVSLQGFLAEAAREGAKVLAYGAAAKGNTLLNFCDIGTDDIAYVVDQSVHKQGRLLPGSHLPVYEPGCIGTDRPDYLLVLPWNLEAEIVAEMSHVRDWGGRFVVAVPETRVLA